MTLVKQLRVVSEQTGHTVDVDLSWENFPESTQQLMDRLDTNDDGVLVYTPDHFVPDTTIEVSHANNAYCDYDSAAQLERAVARCFGSPYNDPAKNKQTQTARLNAARQLRDQLYNEFVKPVCSKKNPKDWDMAKRVLMLSGDVEHLLSLGQQALTWGEDNRPFLDVAEDYLFTAMRLASQNSDNRHYMDAIDDALAEVHVALDQRQNAQFDFLSTQPYVLTGKLSPLTAQVSSENSSSFVSAVVAVPYAFIQANKGDESGALLRYFKERQSLSVRRGTFNDGSDNTEYPLNPLNAWLDEPGSADDSVLASSSPHINQDNLSQGIFGKKTVYYKITFLLPQAEALLGNLNTRRCDLVFRNGDYVMREETGSLVVQRQSQKPLHIALASDAHISIDDWKNVYDIIEGLKADIRAGQSIDPKIIEEVERFYESTNEQLIAFLEQTQNGYREGQVDETFLLGDSYDYTNYYRSAEELASLANQGYYFTNARAFTWMIDRYEVPLYGIPGNHEDHGHKPVPSTHIIGGFPEKQELFSNFKYVTQKYFEKKGNWYESLNALATQTHENPFYFPTMVANQLFDLGLNLPPPDASVTGAGEFINIYNQNVASYNSYAVELPNESEAVFLPTGPEVHDLKFLAKTFFKTMFTDIVEQDISLSDGKGLLKAISHAANSTHLNGYGPGGDNFLALARHLEKARATGNKVMAFMHFPIFNTVTVSEENPDSEDVLDDDSVAILRMLSDYYRDSEGNAILELDVAGHVHERSLTQFSYNFPDENRRQSYYQRLGEILEEKDPDSFVEDMLALRDDYNLDQKMETVRTQGMDGYERQEGVNQDTAFVTLDSLSLRHTETINGYGILTLYGQDHNPNTPSFDLTFNNLTTTYAGDYKITTSIADYQSDLETSTQEWLANEEPDPNSDMVANYFEISDILQQSSNDWIEAMSLSEQVCTIDLPNLEPDTMYKRDNNDDLASL